MSNGHPTTPSGAGSQPGSSTKYWLIGGCGCAALLALIAVVVLAVAYFVGKNAQRTTGGGGATTTFTATQDNIPPRLRENFVPFAFDYPANFRIVESPANFVKVEESTDGTTLENFAVGYLIVPSADADNNAYYPELLGQLRNQFSKQFSGFKEIAQAPETVAGQRGRAMIFEARIGTTPLYGKAILVREPDNPRGVLMILLATNADPEIRSAADVGVRGDLPQILQSFRFLPVD
jgi:hypothetical protein